ncbi:ATP-binding protein [Natranaeroarchaeum aerophilus]|uniref:histidine kinase n=1 Tax=Natranaeroarchaeum aerophilus TaxID=2917711 RepID=A0AAE3FQY9_9EURY|nr:ATP-binding protein [Natranaeroarchaeum aerophilus]MCL9813531.1 ATP-binding protein [Natranaeroarchaeum aerophilus]
MIESLSLLLTQLPLFELYLAAFTAAALTCFVSIRRARRIADRDTRRSLVALLATSGLWAAFHVGYLAGPTASIQYGFYMLGLIVGLATVGPWLYFCSAYTGRALHHNRTYQKIAVAIYLAIVAVKLTNPVHELYFAATVTTDPFSHLMIQHGVIHWLSMGLAYSLAVVGIFMLFELFAQVDYDTRPFVVLVGLTALPVAFDIAGFVYPQLVDLTYSALGVALFAVGVLYIYMDRFETIQLAGRYDDPVVVIGDDLEIRDYNRSAETLFPELGAALGENLKQELPDLAASITSETVIERQQDGETRYYQPKTNPFSASQAKLGQLIIFNDITEQERYRKQLEAQNDRLESFTGMVSHDLRNPLNVAQGNSQIISELFEAANNEDGSYEPLGTETLATVDDASSALTVTLARMERLIDDLLVLAREGQSIEETEPVPLKTVADDGWQMVDQRDATLVVEENPTITADPDRLQQLLENLFRNAIEHGGTDVTIRVGALADDTGVYIEDDGPGVPEEIRDEVFESGVTTNRDGTGFGLAIVSKIATAHGWTIDCTESESGGARFEITVEPTE